MEVAESELGRVAPAVERVPVVDEGDEHLAARDPDRRRRAPAGARQASVRALVIGVLRRKPDRADLPRGHDDPVRLVVRGRRAAVKAGAGREGPVLPVDRQPGRVAGPRIAGGLACDEHRLRLDPGEARRDPEQRVALAPGRRHRVARTPGADVAEGVEAPQHQGVEGGVVAPEAELPEPGAEADDRGAVEGGRAGWDIAVVGTEPGLEHEERAQPAAEILGTAHAPARRVAGDADDGRGAVVGEVDRGVEAAVERHPARGLRRGGCRGERDRRRCGGCARRPDHSPIPPRLPRAAGRIPAFTGSTSG